MIAVSYPILGGNLAEVGAASRVLKEQLKRLGVQADVMRRIMIAAYEAEANVTIHASQGALFARLGDGRIDMEIVDEGPGIPDVALAMTEGYSTATEEARKLGFGAGMGLPNIRKSSDRFSIDTRVGKGTRVLSTILFGAERSKLAGAPGCAPRLEPGACVACLACVRTCPTEAIRAPAGQPSVLEHLCIGCATCLGSCRHGVFRVAETVSADLPAPESILVTPAALLANMGREPEAALAALGAAGFRELRLLEEWEGAILAEAVRAGAEESRRPVIASICPAVTNLIETSFPSLIPHLVSCLSPVEAAARELGLQPVIAVVGCPAQAALLDGDGATGRIRVRTPGELVSLVRAAQGAPPRTPPRVSVGWAERGAGVVRVDGAPRVTRVLAATERGLLGDVEVLDLRACDGGCAGSPLFAGDPAVAAMRLARAGVASGRRGSAARAVVARAEPFTARRGVRLDDDMKRAMEKLRRIDEVAKTLPGRDCSVCGAPTCASLAEDMVLGRTAARCPFVGAGGEG